MLKVNTGDQKINVNWFRLPIGSGEGPTVFNIPGGVAPPPVISDGILQESSLTDFIMMEDGTSYIIQE